MEEAQSPRDKALIHVLYESGCRVGEIAGLKIKHVSFDTYGALLIVNGKTGMRRVRLVASIHHLSTWLEHHPWRKDPDAPLWPLAQRKYGLGMSYASITRQIRKAARRAGVTKAINPHNFRHSRATHLAKAGLNEAQLEAHLGWVPGTKMSGVYVHLAGKDVDEAILRTYGLAPKPEQETFQICPRCKHPNPVTLRFCGECGMPLSINAAVAEDDKKERALQGLFKILPALQDPKIQDLIAQKLAENKE